ncbi:putative glycerol kinase 5 [Cimex lectularius]|uniref:Glycerol kinase 5 n=1 Tax=Cimex lectularius TaxID=79782 RepID=A0A8I6S3H6_CIMLE|nr:putative glycerol kinase 5 [Cimex lectularius]
MEPDFPQEMFIGALDIGTSNVRFFIIDVNGNIKGSDSSSVELLYPKPGYVEIDPTSLWNQIVNVMTSAIKKTEINVSQIKSLGISCQRCTFVTWNRLTNVPYHKFITWKDIRADEMVKNLNSSYTMKCLRGVSKALYTLSRSKRFLAGSVLKLMNVQVTVRLLWVLKNIPGLSEDAVAGNVAFGTIDTWLLHKFTEGKIHLTDVSNASATGLFDPFTMCWADWAIKLFNIPIKMLPTVVDSAGDHFREISPSILGHAIPIRSVVADQSASLYGSCCFSEGDLKVTLGTGTFLNVNTGSVPHASVAGLYPVVGWRYKDELVYLAEGASNDTGTVIKWAQQMGFIEDLDECSSVAASLTDNDGVFFIPAFGGLQAPINDAQASAGFIGVKPTSKKEHLLRAILESIVFRVVLLYDAFKRETNYGASLIRVDGGVSQNDFIMQVLADLTGLKVERPPIADMSGMGAAYLAGLASGVWNGKSDFCKMRRNCHLFSPNNTPKDEELIVKRKKSFELWRGALTRFLAWYK